LPHLPDLPLLLSGPRQQRQLRRVLRPTRRQTGRRGTSRAAERPRRRPPALGARRPRGHRPGTVGPGLQPLLDGIRLRQSRELPSPCDLRAPARPDVGPIARIFTATPEAHTPGAAVAWRAHAQLLGSVKQQGELVEPRWRRPPRYAPAKPGRHQTEIRAERRLFALGRPAPVTECDSIPIPALPGTSCRIGAADSCCG